MNDPIEPHRPTNPWILAIASSVVASVVLWFVPLVGNYLLSLLGQVWVGVLDRAYRLAVVSSDEISYSSLYISGYGFSFTIFYLYYTRIKLPYNQYIKNVVHICVSIMILVSVCLVLFEFIVAGRSVLAKETFERRMLVLTPIYSEEERKALVGSWGAVKSKATFDQLMGQMEILAKKNSAELPKRVDE